MKRISFWFLSTVSAVVLLFGYDASQGATTTSAQSSFTSGAVAGATSSASSTPSASASTSPSTKKSSSSGSSSSASSSPTASATPTQTVTTSKVTGSVINTQWGPVQVQLTVSGGTITKVSVLQYPNGNSRDVEIANFSLPVLIQETLKSQSASIDMVSGATYTSTGYLQSLQSAIDQANL